MNETVHGAGIWAIRLRAFGVRNPAPPLGDYMECKVRCVRRSFMFAGSEPFLSIILRNVYGFISLPTETQRRFRSLPGLQIVLVLRWCKPLMKRFHPLFSTEDQYTGGSWFYGPVL